VSRLNEPKEPNRLWSGGGLEGPMNAMSIANARKALLDLPKMARERPVFIMKYGHPVMVVLSIDQFEGMLETIEILSDNSLIERLQKSIEDARAGKSLSMDEAQARLIPESK